MLLFLALLVPVLSLPVNKDAVYSDSFARFKILPMCAATWLDNPIVCLQNYFSQVEMKRRIDVACTKYRLDRCVGYSAVDHNDQAILLVFRGTQGDLQYFLESEETVLSNRTQWPSGGLVSKYFSDAFLQIWNGGMKDDFLSLRKTYPNYALWIAGHSLGGAMASLSATYIASLNLNGDAELRLVTFGEPRVGNVDYAHGHDAVVPYSFRIIHAQDAVPHLPPNGLEKYHHHKTEIFYNNNMTDPSDYKVCENEETYTCSDGHVDTSFADHSDYFNVPVSSWGPKGCPISEGPQS